MKHKTRLFFLLVSLVTLVMIFIAKGNDKLVYLGISLFTFLVWCFIKGIQDDAVLAADAEARGVWHPKIGDTIFIFFLGWFFLGGGMVTIVSVIVGIIFTASRI